MLSAYPAANLVSPRVRVGQRSDLTSSMSKVMFLLFKYSSLSQSLVLSRSHNPVEQLSPTHLFHPATSSRKARHPRVGKREDNVVFHTHALSSSPVDESEPSTTTKLTHRFLSNLFCGGLDYAAPLHVSKILSSRTKQCPQPPVHSTTIIVRRMSSRALVLRERVTRPHALIGSRYHDHTVALHCSAALRCGLSCHACIQ